MAGLPCTDARSRDVLQGRRGSGRDPPGCPTSSAPSCAPRSGRSRGGRSSPRLLDQFVVTARVPRMDNPALRAGLPFALHVTGRFSPLAGGRVAGHVLGNGLIRELAILATGVLDAGLSSFW